MKTVLYRQDRETMKRGVTLIEMLAMLSIVGLLVGLLLLILWPVFHHLTSSKNKKLGKAANTSSQVHPSNAWPNPVSLDGHEYFHSPNCRNPSHFQGGL